EQTPLSGFASKRGAGPCCEQCGRGQRDHFEVWFRAHSDVRHEFPTGVFQDLEQHAFHARLVLSTPDLVDVRRGCESFVEGRDKKLVTGERSQHVEWGWCALRGRACRRRGRCPERLNHSTSGIPERLGLRAWAQRAGERSPVPLRRDTSQKEVKRTVVQDIVFSRAMVKDPQSTHEGHEVEVECFGPEVPSGQAHGGGAGQRRLRDFCVDVGWRVEELQPPIVAAWLGGEGKVGFLYIIDEPQLGASPRPQPVPWLTSKLSSPLASVRALSDQPGACKSTSASAMTARR